MLSLCGTFDFFGGFYVFQNCWVFQFLENIARKTAMSERKSKTSFTEVRVKTRKQDLTLSSKTLTGAQNVTNDA